MTAAANGGVVSGSGRLVSPGSASALRGTQPGPEKIATGLDKNTFIEGWSLSSPRMPATESARVSRARSRQLPLAGGSSRPILILAVAPTGRSDDPLRHRLFPSSDCPLLAALRVSLPPPALFAFAIEGWSQEKAVQHAP